MRFIGGDQSNRVIGFLNAQGKPVKQLESADALTYEEPWKGQYLFTFIETTTQANPDVNGSIKAFLAGEPSMLIKSLNRPIELKVMDLNGDGQDEFITSEFGFKEGGMFIWTKKGPSWTKQVLNPQTGAAHVDIRDFIGDGDLDVVLGSHAVAKFPAGGFDPAWKQAKGILILRNKTK